MDMKSLLKKSRKPEIGEVEQREAKPVEVSEAASVSVDTTAREAAPARKTSMFAPKRAQAAPQEPKKSAEMPAPASAPAPAKVSLFAKRTQTEATGTKQLEQAAPKPNPFAAKKLDVDLTDLDALSSVAVEEVKTVGADEFNHPGQPKEFTPEEAADLKAKFAYLSENLANRDAISEILPTIMMQVRANPALSGILMPEDLGLIVKSVRASYGVMAANASAKKTKRVSKANEADAFLADLMGSGLGSALS